MLDLENRVMHVYWAELLDMLESAAPPDVARALDLGAGSGTGTFGMLDRFAAAQVVAVDMSQPLLDRIVERAASDGVAGRVSALIADLDASWPDVADVDVALASLSLHHVADPDRVLAELFAALRPGGVVAVAEMTEPPGVLPDDLGLGRPGLERRMLDLVNAEFKHSLPELGSDWASRLTAAGFELVDEREIQLDVRAPYPPELRRFALLWLQRMAGRVRDGLPSDDANVLDALIAEDGPASVTQRDDLHVHGSRTVTVARRPRSA